MSEKTNFEVIQLIKVTLHPQNDPRYTALTKPQPAETLLPISSISNIKKIHNAEYEIYVKQGCLPQTHFAVGQITATFPEKVLLVLNQR